MAEGRMLKRNVSNSRRLAELKTDSARLLWTWIIPYLDVEGRFHASPDLIKGKVVPRLKTFTEDKIEEYLQDMAGVGLIILYKNDGDLYLQYRKFNDFQTLRKDHEGKPLPAPDQLQANSIPTTEQVPRNLIQSNLIKANTREEEKPQPVDNSQKDAFLNNLKTLLEKTKEKYPEPYEQQAIVLFIQSNIRKNPNAITHCINSLIKAPDKVRAVQKYLEAALKIEDGKYNAADSEQRCNEFKKMPGMESIGHLLTGILKPMEAH